MAQFGEPPFWYKNWILADLSPSFIQRLRLTVEDVERLRQIAWDWDRLVEEYDRLKIKHNRLEWEKRCLQETSSDLQRDQTRSRLERHQLREEQETLRRQIKELQLGEKCSREVITNLREILATIRQERDTLAQQNKEVANLKIKRDRLLRERGSIQQELTRLREDLATIRLQRDTLVQQNNELKQRTPAPGAAATKADPQGHYRTLGLDPLPAQVLSDEQFILLLNGAYRAYSQALHPDHGGVHEQMIKLNQAREFLRDSKQRRSYSQ
jgi:myosin heavy subunit